MKIVLVMRIKWYRKAEFIRIAFLLQKANSSTVLHSQTRRVVIHRGHTPRWPLDGNPTPSITCSASLFCVVIGPQTSGSLAVDAALLPKLIGGNALCLHHVPQLIKKNRDSPPD